MASGFTQRFKGKIKATQIWMGRQALNGPAATLNYSTLAGSSQVLSDQAAVHNIAASSGLSIFTIGFNPSPGHRHAIVLTTVSSGVFIKAPAGAAFDASTNTVIKSTYEMEILLVGRSTVNWSIESVFPPSTAGVVTYKGITLSTTT